MSTPQNKRSTRATCSTTSNISLSDIKDLIESSKKELLKAVQNETEKITKCIDQLRLRVESLEKSNEVLHRKNRQMEAEIEELREGCGKELSEMADEIQKRAYRQNNLIISGVPERVDGSVRDRKMLDENFCQELCHKLEVKGVFEEVSRLGRNDTGTKPHLLRVKCKSIELKTRILQNSKK